MLALLSALRVLEAGALVAIQRHQLLEVASCDVMEVADDVIFERFFEIRRFLRLFFRRFANTVLLLTFRSIYKYIQ